MAFISPTDEGELADAIRSSPRGLELRAGGSKRGLGHVSTAENILDLSGFAGIKAYEPEELILEAGPATSLQEIEALLLQRGQMLAFEPPQFSVLLSETRSGTLGGMLNCNLSGPRRLTAGAVRDHALGLSAVDGRGTIFKGGGRVVKNVTGYDMPKLIAGSYGTLAAVTSVVFKVLPKPETELTLLVSARDTYDAVGIMSRAMATPAAVSCAAFVEGRGVFLRIEGIESSVKVRAEQILEVFGNVEALGMSDSSREWHSIREVLPMAKFRVVWRVSTTPSEAPRLVEQLRASTQFGFIMDWAGGLVWIGTDDESLDVRAYMTSGHAMVFKASDHVKKSMRVFHPQAPALAALSQRVKLAFDPDDKLNPGRM